MSQKQTRKQVQYPKRHKKAPAPKSVSLRMLFAGSLLAAVAIAGSLALASQLTNSGSAAPKTVAAVAGTGESTALFAGIPQHGNVLGSPDAPVTLVEYADLQCPYCGDFARNTLPALVADYVRTGQVKLVFRGMAFVGPDSETALRAVVAAGGQNRLWNVSHLLYQNQGLENSGWVTPGLIRSVAGSVPGLDAANLVSQTSSPNVTTQLAALERLAARDGIRSTPSFRVGRTGGALNPLEVHSLDVSAFRPALDRLLRA